MRKLASVRKIKEVKPHPNADRLEIAVVDGWQVIVNKGSFNQGDKVVYFEIDSFLPDGNPDWQFLVDKSSRQFEGVKGHVLKTIRLRGQLSQGFVIKADDSMSDGEDVSERLGVVKYEKPIPAQLQGQIKGSFPSFFPKTDQERIQNVFDEIPNGVYEVTLKLDGSSMSVFMEDGELNVCSRNVWLKETEGNTFWQVARTLPKLPNNLVFQGELMGPNIQGNRERFKTHQFFCFDVYNTITGEYLRPEQRVKLCRELGIQHVPVLCHSDLKHFSSVQDYLDYAEGESITCPVREGVVFKLDSSTRYSFKAISNAFLSGE